MIDYEKNKRDHAKLIYNIGELTGLFADATSLETFLQKIVVLISDHMQSDVCSIYIYYEDTQELVLKATKGLHPDSVGKVKLKLGQGLTGLALKELRPICERNASRNPHFKHFPGIGEEGYESFLAVPILRGQTRIGTMVIQNSKKDYFTDEDVVILRAITSQLANTIETAKLLMALSEKRKESRALIWKQPLKLLKGKVGSEGFAFAQAVVIAYQDISAVLLSKGDKTTYTLEDFYRAVRLTEQELEGFQKQIEEKLSDVASLIFTAQILMLKDKAFVEAIAGLIGQGINPPLAIGQIVREYMERFDKIPNAYLREKIHDVQDIGKRLLKNLVGVSDESGDYEGRIVIAKELFPSDILKLSSQSIKGIILLSGGSSSHLAILARSLQIPLVIADKLQLLDVRPKTKIILDAEVGNIYINPTKEIIASFKEREDTRLTLSKFKGLLKTATQTKDGTRIKLLSNINLLGDIKIAREFHSEGVGLYRSEFPFIVRSNFPTEEEQWVIYKKLVEGMPGKEITFRTLDIGGDKVLSYYDFEKEENPFLGMRSIRFSLRHKDIFSQQLRAILRAGVESEVRIMFPMISSVDEFLEAREVVWECQRSFKKEKIPFKEDVKIGMMVELPAVLEIIDELARESDFFSIGTNDFVQYMLAVDRTNEKVADFYLPHHPSVLRALKRIVDAATAHKKDISICGDMVHNEKYIPYFLGIGIRKFSLDNRYLPKMQRLIATIDLQATQEFVENLLTKSTIKEITQIVHREE